MALNDVIAAKKVPTDTLTQRFRWRRRWIPSCPTHPRRWAPCAEATSRKMTAGRRRARGRSIFTTWLAVNPAPRKRPTP
jgi:hypothetical protein